MVWLPLPYNSSQAPFQPKPLLISNCFSYYTCCSPWSLSILCIGLLSITCLTLPPNLRELALKYNFPDPLDMLLFPPNKNVFKKSVKSAVTRYCQGILAKAFGSFGPPTFHYVWCLRPRCCLELIGFVTSDIGNILMGHAKFPPSIHILFFHQAHYWCDISLAKELLSPLPYMLSLPI